MLILTLCTVVALLVGFMVFHAYRDHRDGKEPCPDCQHSIGGHGFTFGGCRVILGERDCPGNSIYKKHIICGCTNSGWALLRWLRNGKKRITYW